MCSPIKKAWFWSCAHLFQLSDFLAVYVPLSIVGDGFHSSCIAVRHKLILKCILLHIPWITTKNLYNNSLLSVTEALQIAKADSKSSVLILLDLSATLTLNPQILLSTLSSLGITGFNFAGLNPISLVGLSRWSGEGRFPKHINCSLEFLRDQFLDPSSSPYTLHHWVPSYRHMVSPTIAMLMTRSSISHFNQMIQR